MAEKKKYALKDITYERRIGETLKVVFHDGKAIKGELLIVTNYELYLKTDDDRILTVFKNSIKYLY